MSTRKKKMIVGIVGGTIVLLALAYIGVGVFFTSHFLINTEINGNDFSGKSVSEADEFFKEQVKDYTLTIHDINGATETINSSDILLVYNENADLESILEKQNAFLWPKAFFEKNTEDVTFDLSYDDTKLQEKINSFGILQAGITADTQKAAQI